METNTSIFKCLNGYSTRLNDVPAAIKYITDSHKTNEALVSYQYLSRDSPEESWEVYKSPKATRKDERLFQHGIICPKKIKRHENVSVEDLAKVAEFVMREYEEYPLITAIHTNHKNRPHLHFLVNPFNWVTKKKLQSSPKDFHAFRHRLNSFFHELGIAPVGKANPKDGSQQDDLKSLPDEESFKLGNNTNAYNVLGIANAYDYSEVASIYDDLDTDNMYDEPTIMQYGNGGRNMNFNNNTCEKCGATVTNKELAYSQSRYRQTLCYKCQDHNINKGSSNYGNPNAYPFNQEDMTLSATVEYAPLTQQQPVGTYIQPSHQQAEYVQQPLAQQQKVDYTDLYDIQKPPIDAPLTYPPDGNYIFYGFAGIQVSNGEIKHKEFVGFCVDERGYLIPVDTTKCQKNTLYALLAPLHQSFFEEKEPEHVQGYFSHSKRN